MRERYLDSISKIIEAATPPEEDSPPEEDFTPPTPSQVKDELSKTMVELAIKLAAGNVAAKEREQVLKQVESLRSSINILEKQKLVLKKENRRLYAKIQDYHILNGELEEYIEELERKVIQEDDNPSYIAQLHAILDKKDKEIKELKAREGGDLVEENSRLNGELSKQKAYIREIHSIIDKKYHEVSKLGKILDKKDKELQELRKESQKGGARVLALEIENKGLKLANEGWKNKVNELTEEARQCPQTHKF